jgi:hypothetical protein
VCYKLSSELKGRTLTFLTSPCRSENRTYWTLRPWSAHWSNSFPFPRQSSPFLPECLSKETQPVNMTQRGNNCFHILSRDTFVPGMVLSKKHPIMPPTRILVLQITVNTLSRISLPVWITLGWAISHFGKTWNNETKLDYIMHLLFVLHAFQLLTRYRINSFWKENITIVICSTDKTWCSRMQSKRPIIYLCCWNLIVHAMK